MRSDPMRWLILGIGALAGAAQQINLLAVLADTIWVGLLVEYALRGALVGAALIYSLRLATLGIAQHFLGSPTERAAFARADAASYAVFLWPLAGAVGIQISISHLWPIAVLFALAKGIAYVYSLDAPRRATFLVSREWLASLFLLSGFAALIYQIAWQRMLFTLYGVNIESVTVIVAIFMFGLGIGALAGGYAAGRFGEKLPALFLCCEVAIGAFGIASIPLINAVGAATSGSTLVVTSVVVAAVLAIPTALMGATLPILVSYLCEIRRHVGEAVGYLYFVNTLGSALAAFLTVHFLLAYLGLQGLVAIAAAFNLVTGLLVFDFMRRARKA